MTKNAGSLDKLTEAITVDLKRLSFSDYEARIYLSLVQQSPATAYELSMASGVPRPNAYTALHNLNERRAVLQVSENPARYVAVPPRELLDHLANDTHVLCDSLASRLESLSAPADDTHVWTLHGEVKIQAKIEKMLTASERSIWIKAPVEILYQHRDALQAAAERGISQLIIMFGENADHFRFNEQCRVYQHEGDGVRIGVADNLFTLAIDEQQMLTASLTNEVVAAHTRNLAMVTMALSLIRHDYYMAEICERFRAPIVEAYGPYLRDLRNPGYTDEQKKAFLDKTGL